MKKRIALLGALLLVVLGVVGVANAGNGAMVDRANDCVFPVPPWGATELRVQKNKTPSDRGQFHCHGVISNLAAAPDSAVILRDGPCYLPAFFGGRLGVGTAVITPSGKIYVTCKFSPAENGS